MTQLMLVQKGKGLQLITEFSVTTDRRIIGRAHFPRVDRENELILTEAIKKALPQYMKHPILHLQHTERPVGTVTKAEIDAEGALNIEGSIFDTPDTDDVWDDIENGKLTKFSIFGKRDSGSYECAIPPEQRVSPCVTKALTLFSISLVGENAMNPDTFLEVAKGIRKGDSTPDDEKEEKEEDEVEKCNFPKKSDDLIREPGNKTDMLERLGNMEKAHSEYMTRLSKMEEAFMNFTKAQEKESESEEENMDKDKDKEEKVEKAAPVLEPKFEISERTASREQKLEWLIQKAIGDELQKRDAEIKKAYGEELSAIKKAHDELKETVEKMKKETIEKGGHVVVITTKEQIDANPKLQQLEMIGDVV